MDNISSIFWSERFWLPAHLKWNDLVINGIYIMPSCWDLWTCIPVVIFMLLLRNLWEKVFTPIFESFLTPKKKNLESCLTLDKILQKNGLHLEEIITEGVKESSMSRRQVERYVRNFKKANVSRKIKKINESSWLLFWYSMLTCYGIWCLFDEEWITDTKTYWTQWPITHFMPSKIHWYYIIQIGFYLSLNVSLFFDVKRKDFVEMCVHHIATAILLLLSYCDNFYRVGSVILLLHDPCDVLLHLAKFSNYLNCKRLCDSAFATFALMWLITRLIIFPRIVLSCAYEAPELFNCENCDLPYMYYIFCSILVVLQVLHVIWFYFVMKVVISSLIGGSVAKDSRSESESNESSAESPPSTPQ